MPTSLSLAGTSFTDDVGLLEVDRVDAGRDQHEKRCVLLEQRSPLGPPLPGADARVLEPGELFPGALSDGASGALLPLAAATIRNDFFHLDLLSIL